MAGIWLLATAGDRLWLALDRRLPSWDQADYINSAVDHGRALGLVAGGHWQGWAALLDLSPKIPPLASLVNGTVIALAGDSPDEASWALALWHALLLLVVACWGRQLLNPGFGLLCAALVALTPALTHLRVDFTLDMPLVASCALALWLLGRWQAPHRGGHWGQALVAALALAMAVLVKQSALLMLVLPCAWVAITALGRRGRRLQMLVALALVLGLVVPWLHHNWITTLGGTNRAVFESAANEKDPPVLSLASWLWYAQRLPPQLGPVLPLPAVGVTLVTAWKRRQNLGPWLRHPLGSLPEGWGWLIGSLLAGWLATSLSPNKDSRYITPVLPLLMMVIARGWWAVGTWLQGRQGQSWTAAIALASGLISAGLTTAGAAAAQIRREDPPSLESAIQRLRQGVGTAPTTLVVLPGHADLNEQNVSTFGRRHGGQIEGRRAGLQRRDHALVLQRAEWFLLASGDQGTQREPLQELSRRVRRDGRFEKVGQWPWDQERNIELWRRRSGAPGGHLETFDQDFIHLARGMETGPAGLAKVISRIGIEHQLDGHFLYQERVKGWAEQRLRRNPNDADALWSLALLATLQNRPPLAQARFGQLQSQQPGNPWPAGYRAVVLLADWRPGTARRLLELTPAGQNQPVLLGLEDLSRVLSGDPGGFRSIGTTLPAAIEQVKANLAQPVRPPAPAQPKPASPMPRP
ncbi:MAG: glycosyltransferase family 39 protein [Cyanobacteria bacterium]|nr:glycosyltransferase family 39 protein [Cyanobacteriota bacterium]